MLQWDFTEWALNTKNSWGWWGWPFFRYYNKLKFWPNEKCIIIQSSNNANISNTLLLQKQDFMTPKSTICYGSMSSAKIPNNQSPEYSPASEFCYATKSVAFYLQLWVWQFLGYLTDNICTKTCSNTDVVCLVRIHVFIRSFNSCISYDVNKNMSLNL